MGQSQSTEKRQPFLLYLVAGAFLSYIVLTRLQLYLTRRRFIRNNGCKPCAVRLNKDPFLGIDQMRENIKYAKANKLLERQAERFTLNNCTTFENKVLRHSFIVTIEPENIKTVLSLKFKDFTLGARADAFTPLLGHGIFNADGQQWSDSRHLLRPNFAREQIADLEAFERHFKLFLKAIPKDGSTVDLQNLFFRLTIDSATEFLFNHSTDTLRMVGQDDTKNGDPFFAQAFADAQEDVLQRFRLGPFYRFSSWKKRGQESVRICHEYIDQFVDDALRYREKSHLEGGAKEEKYVFLHELAKATKDKKRLRDELINILLAGRDTTASLLSNLFFEISKRPEIWSKLREEVGQLEGRLPSYNELRNLKYLKWCLNESLRIHPVVPGNSRFAVRDTFLPLGGGPQGRDPLFVPAGTIVGYSPYTMHRRPDFYGPDANEFKPERWETLRPGWEYLPFNGGPRICLGQQYALTEASYVTCRLVQEFGRVESREPVGQVWVEGVKLTLSSGLGAKVGLFRE